MSDPLVGAKPAESRTTSRPALGASRLFIAGIAAVIAIALLLTWLAGAQAGIVVIALGCLAWAAARAFGPEAIVPPARSRVFDVSVLVAAAILLFLLLPVAGPGLERPLPVP